MDAIRRDVVGNEVTGHIRRNVEPCLDEPWEVMKLPDTAVSMWHLRGLVPRR